MQEMRNKILEMIKIRGPSLPIQISKQLGTNSIMAGAMLSTLLAQKHLKITNAKIGGSPLYYVGGQEGQLSGLLYPHLKDVHKKAFDLLKQQGVLEDAALEPVNRVALRELPDFAKKLTIYTGDVFWKWYLIGDVDAEGKIKTLVGFQEEHQEEQAEQRAEQQAAVEQGAVAEVGPVPVEMAPEVASFEEVEKRGVEVEGAVGQIAVEQPDAEHVAGDELKHGEPRKHKKPWREKTAKTKQKPGREKKASKKQEEVDEGFAAVDGYFSGKEIEVMEANMVKKNQEYEFLVKIPSRIGEVKFFVQFKSKKSISEGDLSLAQIAAVGKRLPLLFLTNGNLSARARAYAEKHGIVVEKLS